MNELELASTISALSLDDQSVLQLLEDNPLHLKNEFILTRLPKQEELFGSEYTPVSFVGRKKQLENIWAKIISSNSSTSLKSSAFNIHASPGLGKTTSFRKLVSKEEIPEAYSAQAANVVFMAIDFSRSSCDDICYLKEKLYQCPAVFTPLMRLFYTQFIDQKKLSWVAFFHSIWVLVETNLVLHVDIIEWISKTLRNVYRGKRCIILVDELMKSIVLWETAPDDFRIAICKLSDDTSRLCHMVIFSAIDRSLLQREITVSGRSMLSIATLPLFSEKESFQFLDENVPKEVIFEDERKCLQDRDDVLRFLASVCGGHPRSLLKVAEEVKTVKILNQVLVTDIITRAGDDLRGAYRIPSFWLKLVYAAVLGRKVKLNDSLTSDDIPAFSETYESLINRGILLHSLDNDEKEVVPRLPEIFLHWWCRSDTDGDKYREIKTYLERILLLRSGFSAKQFESIHGNWECLLRLLRREEWIESSPGDSCKKVPLQNCYNIETAVVVNKTDVFNVLVDSTTPLKPVKYEANSELILEPNTFVYPSSPVQTGWDMLIVLEVFPQKVSFLGTAKYILPLFIQNKWSDGSTSINKDAVDKCVHHCNSFMSAVLKLCHGYKFLTNQKLYFWKRHDHNIDRFAIMFIANTNHTKVAFVDAPANIVTLFREHIAALYGPIITDHCRTLHVDSTCLAVWMN